MTGPNFGTPSLFGWPPPPETLPYRGAPCALGVPSEFGNSIARGTADAPLAIRLASLGHTCAGTGYDFGDVSASVTSDPEHHLEQVAAMVNRVLDMGLVPLTLGGDHSISFAPIAALACRHDLCVVWLDAHTDYSPWAGDRCHDHKEVLRRVVGLPSVRRVVQIGYRGITEGDERIEGPKLNVLTTRRARMLGPEGLLEHIPHDLRCYLSIDIDVIDPFEAPGTGAPVPDGLTVSEIVDFAELLISRRSICGADVVEVNPRLDIENSTANAAVRVIEALGRGWNAMEKRCDSALPELVDNDSK